MIAVIVSMLVMNAVLLGLMEAAYVILGRRRWKIFMLVEHLATLARNGMPIHAGLRVVGRDLGGFLGTRVVRVAEALEEGRTLGSAFDAAPRAFPPLLRSMLTLGERSGNLSGFLDEMRRSYRRIADLPFQSVYLFLYPLLLSVGINLALSGLFGGIVPKFQIIIQQLGLRDSRFLEWWPRVILANELVLVLCIGSVLFLVMGGGTAHFGASIFGRARRAVDRAILALPLLGGIVRDTAVQQFALCSGLFLRSGATLPEALRAAAEVERNSILRGRMEKVAAAVAEGGRLSAAARTEGLGGADLVWFLETGEASGLLGEHLLLAAVHYETKARLASRLVSRAVVPIFVILNGLVVGGAFFLTFMPILECVRKVTGGKF